MHKIFSSSAPSCVSIANWLINFLKKYMAMVCVCVCVCVLRVGRWGESCVLQDFVLSCRILNFHLFF